MGTQKKQAPQPKRTPQRMCIACRAAAGKRSLVRIVRADDGVSVDVSGKKPGRGAYIHADRTCWQSALESRRVEQALRRRLSAEEHQALVAFMKSLPHSQSGADSDEVDLAELESTEIELSVHGQE